MPSSSRRSFNGWPALRWAQIAALSLILLTSRCASPLELIPPPLPPVLKIGLVAPFEGTYRYVGYDAVYAARLAVREINSTGGVLGWRFELVAYDDRGDGDLAAKVSPGLVVDPDVMAVVGHYLPWTSAVAGPIYADAGLPHIVIGDADVQAETAWRLAPPVARVASAMGTLGRAPGATAVSIWADPTLGSPLPSVLEAYLAAQPVALVNDGLGDVVYTLVAPVDAAERVTAARAMGWDGRVIGAAGLAASAYWAVGSDAVAGSAFVTPYPLPDDLAGTESWIAAYRVTGPHVPAPGPFALPTYEAVYVIAEAVRSVLQDGRTLDRGLVAGALGETERRGWLGEVVWGDDHHWSSMPLYHYRWEAGAAQLVDVLPQATR